jgi:kynurenine formamidase
MENAFLDVSVPIVAGMAHWPSEPAVSIEPDRFPEKGDRSTVSFLHMGSHTGAHLALLEAGKVVVGDLSLAGAEAGRYELICLPLRIKGCDASPVRALLRRS